MQSDYFLIPRPSDSEKANMQHDHKMRVIWRWIALNKVQLKKVSTMNSAKMNRLMGMNGNIYGAFMCGLRQRFFLYK